MAGFVWLDSDFASIDLGLAAMVGRFVFLRFPSYNTSLVLEEVLAYIDFDQSIPVPVASEHVVVENLDRRTVPGLCIHPQTLRSSSPKLRKTGRLGGMGSGWCPAVGAASDVLLAEHAAVFAVDYVAVVVALADH